MQGTTVVFRRPIIISKKGINLSLLKLRAVYCRTCSKGVDVFDPDWLRLDQKTLRAQFLAKRPCSTVVRVH